VQPSVPVDRWCSTVRSRAGVGRKGYNARKEHAMGFAAPYPGMARDRPRRPVQGRGHRRARRRRRGGRRLTAESAPPYQRSCHEYTRTYCHGAPVHKPVRCGGRTGHGLRKEFRPAHPSRKWLFAGKGGGDLLSAPICACCVRCRPTYRRNGSMCTIVAMSSRSDRRFC
jgi:hypothetical protein